MIRTFHAIGQGAFYTEKFDNNFTIVYDCGGQNKKFIINKIENVFEKNETIDIVFISHFHSDHINGLEFLLEYCNVKKIVLPFLHDNMKIQFIIENLKNRTYNNFIINAILNPEETFKNQELVFIEPYNSQNIEEYINRYKKINNYSGAWIYIPFNLYFDKYASLLEIELNKESINITNIVDKIKTEKYKILNIYKSIVGRAHFNTNSLIVYSGLYKKLNMKLQNITFLSNEIITSNKVGCLYLGDSELKDDEDMKKVKTWLSSYWNDISTVQIPHHGSFNNYNKELSWKNSISIISTGFRYSHPSIKVIEDIKLQDSTCAIVTYDESSKVSQYITFEYALEIFHIEFLI